MKDYEQTTKCDFKRTEAYIIYRGTWNYPHVLNAEEPSLEELEEKVEYCLDEEDEIFLESMNKNLKHKGNTTLCNANSFSY